MSDRQLLFWFGLIALIVRILATLRVEVICRDGLLYCHLAECIESGNWLQSNDDWFLFNPFPALIALLHGVSGLNHERAGQMLCAVPAALAVIPLYLWCRDSFGKRIAVATAAIYVFHPILIRNSSEVMREGLYWFAMLWSIYFGWAAVRRTSFWRFIAAGVFATLATLIRIEGSALFVLLFFWALCATESPWNLRTLSLRWAGTLSALLIFPLVLSLLNIFLLPQGVQFRGLGRFQHVLQHVVHQINFFRESSPELTVSIPFQADIQQSSAPRPQVINTAGTAPSNHSAVMTAMLATATPLPGEVRQMANSIPVWNTQAVADPELYSLRRFLILADEQREALFIAQFLERMLHGYKLPVLIWMCMGLCAIRRRWSFRRDLPLILQTSIFLVLFFVHLSTEYTLESRYLFCMIPFVLPWAGYGLLLCVAEWRSWCRKRGHTRWARPTLMAALILLMFAGIAKSSSTHDPEKVFQKEIGLRLMREAQPGVTLAGPDTLRRAAFYARLPYEILPPHSAPAWNWVQQSLPDFVILGRHELAEYAQLAEELLRSPRYDRILADEKRFDGRLVFQLKK